MVPGTMTSLRAERILSLNDFTFSLDFCAANWVLQICVSPRRSDRQRTLKFMRKLIRKQDRHKWSSGLYKIRYSCRSSMRVPFTWSKPITKLYLVYTVVAICQNICERSCAARDFGFQRGWFNVELFQLPSKNMYILLHTSYKHWVITHLKTCYWCTTAIVCGHPLHPPHKVLLQYCKDRSLSKMRCLTTVKTDHGQ